MLFLLLALNAWADFPSPEKISWHVSGENMDLSALAKVKFTCPEGGLYPTHPQQSTKQYAVHRTGEYNLAELRADDDVCLLGQKTFSGPKPACFRATTAEYFVQSDLYRDRCGNVFRGYWEKSFLARDESQGSLLALGRVVWMQGSDDALRAEDRSTFEVKPEEFLFLVKATPAEVAEAEKYRAEALKNGFSFDENTLLFEKREPSSVRGGSAPRARRPFPKTR